MDMTAERWDYTNKYIREVFGRQDEHLFGLMTRAVGAGMPDIAVDAPVGRLLMMLTKMTAGAFAIELGTLAGYSAIWIARGLRPGGRLITIEKEQAHADFAAKQFDIAGVENRIELRVGDALDVLRELHDQVEPRSVDLVFLDADKERYPRYWQLLRPMIAVGGMIVMDNALGGGSWWIDDADHPSRQAVDSVNRALAGDEEFEAMTLPLRQGVTIGLRVG
jgi:predicted O-methyltransferase YrrM